MEPIVEYPTTETMTKKSQELSRRDFVKRLTGATLGMAVASKVSAAPKSPKDLIGGAEHDETYWAAIREHFVLDKGIRYMNNGSYGPSPRSVLDAVCGFIWRIGQSPEEGYHAAGEAFEAVHDKAARFVGCEPAEMALIHNTTEGMSFVANGLSLKAGDEVLISDQEHPGGLCCWELKAKRAGIRNVYVRIPTPPESPEDILNRINDHITPRTKVISWCHMMFTTGLISPIKEICTLARDKGILTVIDGAHPVGMLDFRMSDLGCDFYATSNHKWLMAPKATGMLYAAREACEQAWPAVASAGWDSRDARKFESFGTRNMPEAAGVGPAIDFQEQIGKDKIEARVRALSAYLRAQLQQIDGVRLYTSTDSRLSAAVTSFSIRELPIHRVMHELRQRHHIYSRAVGNIGNAVRLSTHIYNTFDDVDAAVEVIQDMAKRG